MRKKGNIFRNHWKRILILVLFVIFSILSLFIGALDGVTLQALLEGDEVACLVFLHSRVPRTMAIILSAAGLSVAGLIMQAISRNKFMSPSTAGTTDAAALGLLFSFIFLSEQSSVTQTIFSFVFALISTLIFTVIISRLKIREEVYIPLLGMMYDGTISALTTAIAFRFDAMQMLNMFNMGSFARLGDFRMVYIVIFPIVLSVMLQQSSASLA